MITTNFIFAVDHPEKCESTVCVCWESKEGRRWERLDFASVVEVCSYTLPHYVMLGNCTYSMVMMYLCLCAGILYTASSFPLLSILLGVRVCCSSPYRLMKEYKVVIFESLSVGQLL